MKSHLPSRATIFRLLFLGYIVLISFAPKLHAEIKYGLIVGVGNLPEDTRWNHTSAANDVKVMEQALRSKGFDSIIVLVDENATKIAILAAMEQAYHSLRMNDVFVFHFSGHGQKLADDNRDEIDGYDEALIAHGAPSEYDRWYNDEHHIRDDLFSEIIDRIRVKLGEGGNLLVLFDAGFGPPEGIEGDSIRGGIKAIVPDGFDFKSVYTDVYAGIYEDRPFGSPAESYAPIICISGALANQVGIEYNGNGLLTLAFDRAFEETKMNETYADLFARMILIIRELGLNQVIVIEGSYEREVFDGITHITIDSLFATRNKSDMDNMAERALMANKQFRFQRLMNQDARQKSLF